MDKQRNQTSIPEHLQSRLRLFLSIDLVGSTALKQKRMDRTTEDVPRWRDPIFEFYHLFQSGFARQWHEADNTLKALVRLEEVDPPRVWKAAGDELIYSLLIADSYQACLAVRAFIQAALIFRKEIKQKFPSLDIKMAGWVAGFPVINAEIVFGTEKLERSDDENFISFIFNGLNEYYKSRSKNKTDNYNQNLLLDFIGPSMDIGFRLCGLASPRKMPISVELAFIIARTRKKIIDRNQCLNIDTNKTTNELINSEPPLRYSGRQELKGVLDGRTYPVFWLDTAIDDPLEKTEDQILQKNEVTPDQCIDLVNAFIESINNPYLICQPYLNREPSGILPSDIPDEHERVVSSWHKEFLQKEEIETVREESESQESEETPMNEQEIDLNNFPSITNIKITYN